MNKKTLFMLFLLMLLYLFTRVYHLLLLPIFEDEAIYIYWAKVVQTTHAQWFISLADGKPPLLVWLIGIFLTILPQKMFLLAGRLPSVIAGLFSVCAIYGIGSELFKSKRIGYISSILYIIFPFALAYDRMALFDSLLSSMLLCSTYFMIRTARTYSYKDAVGWGFFLGLAFLSKPTALFFLVLLPFSFLLLSPLQIITKDWKKTLGLLFVSAGIAEVMNNLQRVSHVYSAAAVKNAQFQLPLSELIKSPFALTLGNLNGFFSWMEGYYTIFFFVGVVFSLIVLLCLQWRKGLMLTLLWLLPIIALATVGQIIFPRYILFTTPYTLIAFAATLEYLLESKYKIVAGIVGIVLIIPLLTFDYYIVTNPVKAPFPINDYQQLVSDSPSGYGVKGITDFINQEKAKGPVVLVTQGTFGIYPYAFTLEYWGDPKVTIVPRWPLDTIDQDIFDMAKTQPVYILLKQDRNGNIHAGLPVQIFLRSEKPSGIYPLVLTKLIPQTNTSHNTK